MRNCCATGCGSWERCSLLLTFSFHAARILRKVQTRGEKLGRVRESDLDSEFGSERLRVKGKFRAFTPNLQYNCGIPAFDTYYGSNLYIQLAIVMSIPNVTSWCFRIPTALSPSLSPSSLARVCPLYLARWLPVSRVVEPLHRIGGSEVSKHQDFQYQKRYREQEGRNTMGKKFLRRRSEPKSFSMSLSQTGPISPYPIQAPI